MPISVTAITNVYGTTQLTHGTMQLHRGKTQLTHFTTQLTHGETLPIPNTPCIKMNTITQLLRNVSPLFKHRGPQLAQNIGRTNLLTRKSSLAGHGTTLIA